MNSLKASNISKHIKSTTIVKNISLEINSSEIVGLLGPNGAGKTTSFYMICGLLEASGGNIYFNNIDISKYPLHKRAKIGIGYLPQESSIFKDLSVEKNLLIAGELAFKDRQARRNKIEQLLELFDIKHIRLRKGISLSGGERRRVEIARALVNSPKFLLLDEPFAGVDPIAVADIQEIIKGLAKLDIGVLITDHNVRETLGVCDRAYVIKSGELLASGTSQEVYDSELVKKHYLGESFKI